ncbi:zinc finger MYND domain-containing protein 12 isoform X2 [Halichoeres trimaculatus]|uniref:zinc finger MYND domain-containing protein 12 isoform X2 n=1 Tax=Halichoeres trimaculatus TaxID=147232 RepID=UPI003D9E2DE2
MMADTLLAFGKTSQIIPLSLPKGTEKLCELCQRPANLQCTDCRVTFYCLRECRIQIPLIKADLLKICRSVAQGKLSEGKHKEALPAAQFYLRCSIDIHGPNSAQLVPVYLLLAEANMGLGNLASVAELLSQAEWAVLKSPECGHGVYQQLHRSLGRLHAAIGNLDAALVNFANDVYYASEEYGLDSTVTCRGYFLMADVFNKQGKIHLVRSLYSEVARTLHGHLTHHLKIHIQNVQNHSKLLEPSLDKSQRTEVDATLRAILEFWQANPRRNSGQIALVALCLAMLWFLGGDSLKALGFGNVALQACQLIPNHDLTEPIQGLLQLVQSAQTEPRPGSG